MRTRWRRLNKRIEHEVLTFEYFVRNHYKMPPKDPRALAMTERDWRNEWLRIQTHSRLEREAREKSKIKAEGGEAVVDTDGEDAFDIFDEMVRQGVPDPFDAVEKVLATGIPDDVEEVVWADYLPTLEGR